MCCLYGISRVLEKTSSFVEGGVISGSQLTLFYEAKEDLLDLLKPEMLGIMDVNATINDLRHFYCTRTNFVLPLLQKTPMQNCLTGPKTRTQ